MVPGTRASDHNVGMAAKRPSAVELRRARRLVLRDVIAPRLRVLFCGINPGLYSAAVGHHFARPGNRFWKALHGSGFTPRLFSPFEDADLALLGLGVTNLAPRTTARADELSAAELVRGARELEAKVARQRPRVLAILGVGAYRLAFGRPEAVVGRQAAALGGTLVWVLPNPSGLNAHYGLPDLVRHFRALRQEVDAETAAAPPPASSGVRARRR
jgi:TDG/mug DNA glycosylase family protein